MRFLVLIAVILLLPQAAGGAGEWVPIIDTHIHYSHDAWEIIPPKEAVRILREAGLKRAFVSSSSDDGTQMLYREAPDLIVPVLRPYRQRGETGTWFRDETVVAMIEGRLAKYTYAGFGEFHISGDDANLPVMRRIVQLAKKYRIFLHAHSDAAAIENIFAQNPEARVLWAHSGFEPPEQIAEMLRKYPNLTADLAFRRDHATNGKVDPAWRNLFLAYPDRFSVGTDTYTPERWHEVINHANWSRKWLKDLPRELAENIAHKNAQALADWALGK